MVVMNVHKKVLMYADAQADESYFVGFLDALVAFGYISRVEHKLYHDGYVDHSFKNIKVD
jgi:hypothetical protein